MRGLSTGLTLLCGVLASGLLMAGTVNELELLKASCATEKTRIHSVYEQQKTNAFGAYRQSVDTQMLIVQQKGDLDNYLALQAEKKRIAAEKTIATNDVLPVLAGLVTQYQKAMQEAAFARDKATINLLRLYVARLTTLMQNDTRTDHLEEAKAVRDELQAAKTESTFLEADLPAEPPKPTPPEQPSPEQPSPANDLVKAVAGTWTFTWRNLGRSGTDTVVLNADGTASCANDTVSGSWTVKERQCTIHWPATDNILTVIGGEKRMIGHSRQGVALTAVKTEP
jgi:hypothetical protein